MMLTNWHMMRAGWRTCVARFSSKKTSRLCSSWRQSWQHMGLVMHAHRLAEGCGDSPAAIYVYSSAPNNRWTQLPKNKHALHM
jgi:hypothetical protein